MLDDTSVGIERIVGGGFSTSWSPNPLSPVPKRKKVMLFTPTRQNTNGLAVVVNNLATGLKQKGDCDVYILVNDIKNEKMTLYTPDGQTLDFSDRQSFVNKNQRLLREIDVFNIHSSHISDEFVYFGTQRKAQMPLPNFLSYFTQATVVYTDHSNPTMTLDDLAEAGIQNYTSLSSNERRAVLEQTKLREMDPRFSQRSGWSKGYSQTMLLATQQLYELADTIVHVSDHQWQYNRRIVPGQHDPLKHVVVYNGLDITRFRDDSRVRTRAKALRTLHDIHDDEKVLLYAGRATEGKGFHDFLAAATRLTEKGTIPHFKAVVMAGVPPDVQERVRRTYPLLADSLIFTGFIQSRETIAAYNLMADIAIQPTKKGECFNQSIGEAIALGTPAITYNFAGPKEVYVDRGLAYGVPRGDIDALSNQIEFVLRNPRLAREKTERAQGIVCEELSLEAMVHSYQNVFNRTKKKHTASPVPNYEFSSSIYASSDYQAALENIRSGRTKTAKHYLWKLRKQKNTLEVMDLEVMIHQMEKADSHRHDPRLYLGEIESLGINNKGHNKHRDYITETGSRRVLAGLVRVVDLDFMNTYAWKSLARGALDDMASIQRALRYIEPAILVSPSDSEAHLIKALAYEKLGRRVDAAEEYLKVSPRTSERKIFDANAREAKIKAELFWNNKEIVLQRPGDQSYLPYKNAIENFLIANDTASTRAALYLIRQLYTYGKVQTDQQRAELEYYCALGKERLGEIDGAIKTIEKALPLCESSALGAAYRKYEELQVRKHAATYATRKFDVSYVMPTYNQKPEFIYQSIDSILRQENYNGNIEVIVVDDGSPVDVRQTLQKRYAREIEDGRVKVLRKQNNGAADARNLALRVALAGNTKYITFLDDDDIATPQRTKILTDFLEKNTDIGFVHGRVDFIDQEGIKLVQHPTAEYFRRCWDSIGNGPYDLVSAQRLRTLKCPVNNQSAMVRADVIKAAGYQHSFWRRAQDMMYWKSIAETGTRFGFVNECVARYRVR